MQAVHDHVLVKLPHAPTMTKGGVHLPDQSKQKDYYGRVISVGALVQELKVGDIVMFDPAGIRKFEFNSLSDTKTDVLPLVEAQVYCKISEAELRAEGYEIPESAEALCHS